MRRRQSQACYRADSRPRKVSTARLMPCRRSRLALSQSQMSLAVITEILTRECFDRRYCPACPTSDAVFYIFLKLSASMPPTFHDEVMFLAGARCERGDDEASKMATSPPRFSLPPQGRLAAMLETRHLIIAGLRYCRRFSSRLAGA